MTAKRRARLRRKLQQCDLSGFLGLGAANFRYLSDAPSAFLELSHQLCGTDMVLVPAHEDCRSVILINEYSTEDVARATDISDLHSYPNWTENRPLKTISDPLSLPITRPEQFDFSMLYKLLTEVLAERDLLGVTLGADLASVPAPVYERLARALAPTKLVDATDLLYELRAVKDADEIVALRAAARLFDIGVGACFDVVKPQMTRVALHQHFDLAVQQNDHAVSDATFFFPHLGTRGDDRLQTGDILKIDAGARVNGYWSDGCRHAVLGKPSAEATLIHNALFAGFCAARDLLRPSVTMREIYQAAMINVREKGLPGYSRGHVGHSIGLDNHQEEPPFIGPNDTTLAPGMVICLEVPFYPPDVGGFNIEDMFLITEDGAESLTHARRDLQELI